jgi:hypothetical protein
MAVIQDTVTILINNHATKTSAFAFVGFLLRGLIVLVMKNSSANHQVAMSPQRLPMDATITKKRRLVMKMSASVIMAKWISLPPVQVMASHIVRILVQTDISACWMTMGIGSAHAPKDIIWYNIATALFAWISDASRIYVLAKVTCITEFHVPQRLTHLAPNI